MPTLSYPGVYMEEVSSGVRPISAASTSIPAFVGVAETGPTNTAKLITSWTNFQRSYGTFLPIAAKYYLAYSVFQFFNNGGQQCYVVRVGSENHASVTLKNRAGTARGVKISARYPGVAGNDLSLDIVDGGEDPINEFSLTVRDQSNAILKVFDNVNMTPGTQQYFLDVIQREPLYLRAELLDTTTSQKGIHRGGEEPALPLRADLSLCINLDGDGFRIIELADTLKAETDLAKVAAEITTKVSKLLPQKPQTSSNAFALFECVVESIADSPRKRLVLKSGSTGSCSSVRIDAKKGAAAAKLKLGEPAGQSEDGSACLRPVLGTGIELGKQSGGATPVTAAVPGADLVAQDYEAGFQYLNKVSDFSLLAVPGIGTTEMIDLGMRYCQNRPLQDVFFLGDADPEEATDVERARSYSDRLAKSSYGAVYFPWLSAADPLGRSREPIKLPPSGFVAGLYARIDAKRGVWKAPAGTEATLSGVLGLAYDLTDVEHGNLNQVNVNCIRRFATAGIVAWGARTLSSDAAWRYVPVRRTAIMLRVSLYNGLQWAVFEPNDEELWSQIRLNITSFMLTLFRRGAFQGATPSQAFFVQCDQETNPQADIDLGIVNVLVGFAPLKPAEFVVVKISQKAGQNS